MAENVNTPNKQLASSEDKHAKNLLVYPGVCRRITLSNEPNGSVLGVEKNYYSEDRNQNRPRDPLKGCTNVNIVNKTGQAKNWPPDDNSRASIYRKQSFDLDWIDSKKYHRFKREPTKRRRFSAKSNKEFWRSSMESNKQGATANRVAANMMDPDSEDILLDINSEESASYFEGQKLEGQLSGGVEQVEGGKHGGPYDYNQLDEPILDTLLRDLSGIYQKTKMVALPLDSSAVYKVVLRGWDLWGPLLLCTFLALAVHSSDEARTHAGPQFADVFVLIWFGSGLVSLNYRLLCIASGADERHRPTTATSPVRAAAKLGQVSAPMTRHNESAPTGEGSPDARRLAGGDESSASALESPPALKSAPSLLQLMCVFGYCLVAPCVGAILLKFVRADGRMLGRALVGLLLGFLWPTLCAVRVLARYQPADKRALAVYPIGLFYFVLSSMIILND